MIMKNISLENSGLLGHNVMSLGEWFPSIRRDVVLSSSVFKQSNKTECEGTTDIP